MLIILTCVTCPLTLSLHTLCLQVWNDTVANLSLLALGTSAPEILLSVIEIIGKGFKAGELGPSTIVGSAAFNLLVISAICIASIPTGEIRRIANVKVFAVTAFSGEMMYFRRGVDGLRGEGGGSEEG